jgi:hypothetical protein
MSRGKVINFIEKLLLPIILLAAVIVATYGLSAHIGEMLTRNSVRLSLAWYTAALLLMMWLTPRDWYATTRLGSLARWCWTWALVTFLVHLVMAFHYYHHWSHAHAFERTRQVSGVGEGLYVSYLFTVLWTADVLFWWLSPARYAARPACVCRTMHCFMLFVVFNSMVVFEAGLIRWAGLIMFAVLGIAWWASSPRGSVRSA